MKNLIYFPLITILLFACNNSDGSIEPVTEEITSVVTEEIVEAPAVAINEVLSPNDFKEFMEQETNFVLLDIRTPEELVENGTMKGAINVDYYNANFQDEIAKLNKEEAVYIYCRSGGRSGEAAKIFKDAGFQEVYDLEGGYNAWLANSNN